MELIPVRSERMNGTFNLLLQLRRMLRRSKVQLLDGDILVISGKFLAMSQGRFIKISETPAMEDAKRIAKDYSVTPSLAELVAREGDYMLGGLKGFLLTIKNGSFSPNAGIDKSNIMKGYAILHPLRMGTVGIAIGAAGLPSVVDDRGRKDLFGNVMRVTRRAIADNIASAA